VDQVQTVAVLEPLKITPDAGGKILLQGNQALKPEDRVIQVTLAGAVLYPAVFVELGE
jgi:hypothetical protein|tara:strand:+ start:142 stop:315 length:174 start_codon:yes stop_codon:yes gene_type:complete